jgi:hypothetical protein
MRCYQLQEMPVRAGLSYSRSAQSIAELDDGLWTVCQYAALGAAIWSLGEALIPKQKPTIEP